MTPLLERGACSLSFSFLVGKFPRERIAAARLSEGERVTSEKPLDAAGSLVRYISSLSFLSSFMSPPDSLKPGGI